MGNGTNLFLLGELQQAETAARRASQGAGVGGIGAINMLEKNRDEWVAAYEKYVFRAKGHVHTFRSVLHARKVVEDQLIAALKAENANHPLASKEAVEAVCEEARLRAVIDPEVIRRTYPEGLPEGVLGGSPPDVITGGIA